MPALLRGTLVLCVCAVDAAWQDAFNSWKACDSTSMRVLLSTLGVACKMKSERTVESQPIKVFGAGLSKTGTSSLHDALNGLGYKTYHVRQIAQTEGHIDLWYQAATTGDLSAVFDRLSWDGFNATTDMPTAALFREALQRYPAARFILTVRDQFDWVRSYQRHSTAVKRVTNSVFLQWVEPIQKAKLILYWMRTLLPYLEPGDCFMRPTDPAKCVESYLQHNDDVIATIPREQLLVFDVREGYGPLCKFLEVPHQECPSEFPHSNAGQQVDFVGMVVMLLDYALCAWCLGVTYLLYLSLLAFTARQHRIQET